MRETVRQINTAFLVCSVILGVIDLLLLVTVISATARERSAALYLYHLTFVTIILVIFTLPSSDHYTFGVCLLLLFSHWVLLLVYNANIVLLNIEILGTIFTSNPRWKVNPRKRFFISMTATWISCILFSVLFIFFGHEGHKYYPLCFIQNNTAKLIALIVKDWIPAVMFLAQTITGLVLFIRMKRRPENYSHMMENQNSLRSFNEWFACFMTLNLVVMLVNGLIFQILIDVTKVDFHISIFFQYIISLSRFVLPFIFLMLGEVRDTYKDWAVSATQILTGRKRASQHNATDMMALNTEALGDITQFKD